MGNDCIDQVARNTFTQTSEASHQGSAFRDGRMSSHAVAGFAEDKHYRVWVATDFYPEPALGFRVTTAVRLIRGATEAWAAPLGGFAAAGISLELKVTRRATGELIGSDELILDSRNTPGFFTSRTLEDSYYELACNGELGEVTGGVKVAVTLHTGATAGAIAGASAQAEVDVTAVNLERCCVRPLEVPEGMIPLHSWWSYNRGDNFCTSQAAWAGCAGSIRILDYRFARFEGFAFDPHGPRPEHTIPIHSWYNDARGDNFITSDPRWGGEIDPNKDGYFRFRHEGFVFDPKRPQPPGRIRLFSWWNHHLLDNFATSNPRWAMPISDIEWNGEHIVNGPSQAGYTLYRLEGFVMS